MADRDVVKLDPRFFLPPGVENLEYDTDENMPVYDSEGEEYEQEDFDSSVIYDDTSEDERPGVPDYISVVSQTVRTLPGGGQVVDVVLELPDLEDGIKYEIRESLA